MIGAASGAELTAERPRIGLVIPVLNEEEAIPHVLANVPPNAVDEIVVVDGGSTDRTAERAAAAGARVIVEPRPGYGRACLAGACAAGKTCAVVVFLDGDGSDCPERIPDLVAPILAGKCDFVVGSRSRGEREPGSMSAHQLVAGYAIGGVLRLLYGARYTDMGPFRAIGRDALFRLGMREMTYGWNLEMQMRAARAGLRVFELPVPHRRRVGGASKVSGTVAGTMRAGLRILLTLARVALERQGPAHVGARGREGP
ncbi:MAG: glycosyltransferase family 2 protein [Stellaceae bacterium]